MLYVGGIEFVFEENSVREVKWLFQNVFLPHDYENPAFANFSGLKSVFENLCLLSDRLK